MNERLAQLWAMLTRRRSIPFFEGIGGYVRTMRPGDRLIFSVLAILLCLSSLSGLYALEHSLLVEQPAYGGSLTEGVVGSPRFVNPLLALTDADRDVTALTYAGLMGLSGDGTLVPVLAESYTISEDGRVYTFVIREYATFSDGTPVTADDVVYTVEKAQDPGLKSPQLANWSNIRAEALDPRTVVFTLPKAYRPFLEDTTLGILPSHLWKTIKNEEFPFTTLMSEPVGAGPFTISNVVRDSSGVITEYGLSAFRGYAPSRPFLDGMTVKFYASQTDLAQALKRGAVESAQGIPTEGALRAPYARVFGVFFNPDKNPVFAHLEVRKALSLAINRDEIVQNVLGGYATALMGPVPPGGGIEPTPLPDPATRLDTARAALTDAGWKYNEESGVWENAKKKLTLSTITIQTSNVPELRAVAAEVEKNWEELGVPVAIEFRESGDLTQNVIRPREYDALLFGMVVGREHDLFAFWSSSERNDPGLNIALYANKTVDALLEKRRAATTLTSNKEDLAKINSLIAADYPAAFTHAPDFVYSIPDDLEGVRLPQITAPADRFAGVASWYRRSEFVWPFLARSK